MRIQPLYDRSVPDKCPGLYRPFTSPDGKIVRVRSGGQYLKSAQLRAFAQVAKEYGDGQMQITTRGAIQIRGIQESDLPKAVAAIESAGLVPKPSHEIGRNIVVSPLTGLDNTGVIDLRSWAKTLDEAICAESSLVELPGRFLFGLDDGRGDIAALRLDLCYQALDQNTGLIQAGEKTWKVTNELAIPALISLAKDFVAARREMEKKAWHISELPQALTLPAEFLGLEQTNLPQLKIQPQAPTFGNISDKDNPVGVVVGIPLGLISSEQLITLCDLSEELLITPFRSIILPNPKANLAVIANCGLIIDPSSAWGFIGACTGTDGCARAEMDVREIARKFVSAYDSGAITPDGHPVYVSSCNRRCGAPNVDYHDIFNPEDFNAAIAQLAQPLRQP